jgi:hypothetical protein
MNMTVEYLADAPVKQVAAGEGKRLAAALRSDLDGWGGSGDAAWDKRVKDTGEIAFKLVADKGSSYEETYVYMLTGAVAGVLVIDEDAACMHVKFLVTHPGTQLVGGALLEKAVERSCQEGYNGRLELISHSDESSAAYACLGFEALPSGKRASHQLNPANSAHWVAAGKTFVLTKHAEKKYVG